MLNLWGYSGWNTSSNSLGTVICQAIFRYHFGDTESHRLFTALRIYEDVCYYADVRHDMRRITKERFNLSYFDVGEIRGTVTDTILPLLRERAAERYPEIADLYEIQDCSLPWKRIFEIRLEISKK